MIYVWQPEALLHTAVWGFVATAALSTVLQGSQGLGLSRLSLPFLVGTLFTGRRDRAMIYGTIFYVSGGWIFAFMYYLVFSGVHLHHWWFGALIGALHGLMLLVVALPILPHIHPRIATEFAGPAAAGAARVHGAELWPHHTADHLARPHAVRRDPGRDPATGHLVLARRDPAQ
jgi:hypothetical protein